MKPLVPLLAVCAVLLTGCSGTAVSITTAHQAVHAAKPAPLPTSTPEPAPTASVGQFEAVIAANEKAWRAYDANIDACTKAGDGTSADDYTKFAACIKNAQAMTVRAKTATETLQALSTPPPEIRALMTKTMAALARIQDSNAGTTCQDAASDACLQSADTVDQAAADLGDALDGWDQLAQPQ